MNKKINDILGEVLVEIKPSKEDENKILKEINDLIKKINSGLKDGKAVLGGSGAKGSWLKTFDADIFVLFDYKKFKDNYLEISDILEKHLKKKFKKIERIHGSRDYFQIKIKNTTIEIIPLLNIKNEKEAKNITDISQLHSKWVNKNSKNTDEIRLTKQFCKANNVYGAESYIQGFSGYICEILTIYYGSFMKLVKNVAKWKDKVVLDPENYFKGKNIERELNKSKLVSPLILIDPVQKSRNAAAALSYEKFDMFRVACKKFLKQPGINYFKIKTLNVDEFRNKNKVVIEINVNPKKSGKRDVIGGKILKAFEFLIKESMLYGFKIIKYDWSWDEKNVAKFIFVVDDKKIPKEVTLIGPPLKLKNHVEKFKKAHKKTFVRGSKIMAIEKRKFETFEKYIKNLVKNNYFSERVVLTNIKTY